MSTISQQFADLIADAFSRGLSRGEEISYDVSMLAMPGPQGQPQPMLGLTFSIKATAMDQMHAMMVLVQPVVPSQETVDDMLRQIVESLVQTRANAAQQFIASQNGHSKSGLILPN